ncbi:SIR2 family NAD-dependent protein deacylase [Neisseria zalophi]|uniref:NAD-dependent protein deacylase n=1 Tax=Neisseria zalophi TaxID=640030 RepID=A0A5J6PV03_9NEIS|nr:Sir2 family NAD-dependent protein deacetylase [Neisseria zalophi]QEY26618.1 NAD-dependent deacylase [Neisseria zalophi]
MKKCVVLSGAGISADSGLKTFRDAGGLWEGYKVTDVCTPEAFARNPDLVLDFYNMRRQQANQAMPNAAHEALVRLESYYHVQIITQNVDDLHERAGSSHVLHLHGELNKVRSCVDENEILVWTGDLKRSDTDGKGHPLRPHIVWFGEEVPAFPHAVEQVRDADVVMVVGTSLQVYPAASLLEFAPPQAECYLVDPNPRQAGRMVEVVPKKAKDGVPTLVEELIRRA